MESGSDTNSETVGGGWRGGAPACGADKKREPPGWVRVTLNRIQPRVEKDKELPASVADLGSGWEPVSCAHVKLECWQQHTHVSQDLAASQAHKPMSVIRLLVGNDREKKKKKIGK